MKIWAILGIILALSAIGSGIYVAGKRATRAEYAERDNAAIKAAYEARDKALAKVAEVEAKSVKDVQAAESKANKEITNVHKIRDAALADVATGKLRLRNLARCPAPSDRNTPSQAGPAPGLAAEGKEAGLPDTRAGDIIRLLAEADEVTIERNACVAIATSDRKIQ